MLPGPPTDLQPARGLFRCGKHRRHGEVKLALLPIALRGPLEVGVYVTEARGVHEPG